MLFDFYFIFANKIVPKSVLKKGFWNGFESGYRFEIQTRERDVHKPTSKVRILGRRGRVGKGITVASDACHPCYKDMGRRIRS